MSFVMVFDCDDVLVSSRHAVRDAYIKAGVTPPDNFWGKSRDEWLVTACDGDPVKARAVHSLKNRYYRDVIDSGGVPMLSGGEAFHWLQERMDVAIMTSASGDALDRIIECYDFRPVETVSSATALNRTDFMRYWLNEAYRPIVIDDQLQRRKDLPSGCGFIHYSPNMTRDQLLVRVLECML